ncbi:DNA-binding protein, partial [Prevotella sp. P2-180]
ALKAAYDAIGHTIKAWGTEGHSVVVPGLGTMRFAVNSKAVEDVNLVASSLITTRKIIFTPSVDVKKALKEAAISITCYDRNGNVVKRVNSGDSGEIEDPENPSGGEDASGGGSGGDDLGQ